VFNNVLVVCVGNICRSPLGQFMLQQRLPGKTITSAGLAAMVGHDVNHMTRTVAEACGLLLPTHAAVQVTSELCRAADLILVMERGHREALSQMAPQVRGKTFLFGEPQNGLEIEDPYGRSREIFELVHQRIETAADGWAKKLGA